MVVIAFHIVVKRTSYYCERHFTWLCEGLRMIVKSSLHDYQRGYAWL